jgi:hypothetical protein
VGVGFNGDLQVEDGGCPRVRRPARLSASSSRCRQWGHVTSPPATVQPALREPGAAPQMALIHG